VLGHLQVKAHLQLTIIIKRKHTYYIGVLLGCTAYYGVRRDLVVYGIFAG
jgi:hypothetical protein